MTYRTPSPALEAAMSDPTTTADDRIREIRAVLNNATLTTGPAALSRIREIIDSAPPAPNVSLSRRQWRAGDPEPGLDVVAVQHSNSQLFGRVVVTTAQTGVPLSAYSFWRAGSGDRLSWHDLTRRLGGYTLTEVAPDEWQSAVDRARAEREES